MQRFILVALSIAAVGYVGICAALFFFQRSFIYYPRARAGDSGAIVAVAKAGERVLATARPKAGRRALIYFGGNAEDVSLNLPALASGFPESAIYLMHYRGYGGSGGEPSEQALFADAVALFDQVQVDHAEVDVIGRSLGSGVAVYVASVRAVRRLALVTPYDSLEGVATGLFPAVPVRWILLDKYESWRYAPKVSASTLILAAEHDEVIPRKSTELLATRFRSGVSSMKVIPGVGHNTISDTEEYMRLLSGFLR